MRAFGNGMTDGGRGVIPYRDPRKPEHAVQGALGRSTCQGVAG